MSALETAITALTMRAERAEAEADRLIVAVKVEQARAERLAHELTSEREARLKIKAALTVAEREAAALREADQDRRRLGLLARLRAAVRPRG